MMIRGLSHSRDRGIHQPPRSADYYLLSVCTPVPLTLDHIVFEIYRLCLVTAFPCDQEPTTTEEQHAVVEYH